MTMMLQGNMHEKVLFFRNIEPVTGNL